MTCTYEPAGASKVMLGPPDGVASHVPPPPKFAPKPALAKNVSPVEAPSTPSVPFVPSVPSVPG
jgi:hypothetical protein